MSKLKETLAKLNKARKLSGELTVDMLEDKEKSYLDRGFISTGSVLIDHLIKGHYKGGYTLVTGWQASGKSSLLLATLAEFQKNNPDEIAVVFDGEGSFTSDDLERFGIRHENLLIEKTKKLELFLDTCEAISKAEEIGLILVDSIKSFYSMAIEAKSAEDNTIGIEAKKFNARMPIILSNCYERHTPIIMTHQWRQDPGKTMGDNRVLSGGKWVEYDANNHIDLSKKDFIRDDEGRIIGHVVRVRIKKSKQGAFDPKEVYETNFYYEGGFNHEEEYIKIMISKGIITRGGAWYSFPNKDGEEVKLQGELKVAQYLKDNPEDYKYLKNMLDE